MHDIFNSLHEYMLRTEGITYLLILAALGGIAAFWYFLTEKD